MAGERPIEADPTVASAADVHDTLPSAPASTSVTGPADRPDYPDLEVVSPDHYVVLDELARGGMGQVVRARDRRLGREVAIKSLLRSTPELATRLEREARITARLNHPAIVNVHEAGVWPDGEPFYAMELVAGRALGDVIAETRGLEQRLALLPHVITVADALAYAHSRKVIHRDLKPSNVLVGEFGETVVIDWGLAKEVGERVDDEAATADARAEPPVRAQDDRTVAGSVLGTPAYMPPEQAEGSAVDERADVYALGAMLYHLLAGRAPYVADSSVEILAAVVEGPPPAIERVAPGVPRELVTIIAKAMAREPRDRYPSARELVEDLKKFQTGQLVGSHRYTTRQLVARWIRRHRASMTVGALASAALAVVAVVSVQRIMTERARTAEQRETAEQLMDFMLTDLRGKLAPLGKLPLLESISERAVAYYDARADQLDDVQQARRAIAHWSLGLVRQHQGRIDAALVEEHTSLAIDEALVARDPGNAVKRRAIAAAHVAVGDVLRTQGRLPEALHELLGSLATLDSLSGLPELDLGRDRARVLERIGLVRLAEHDTPGALESWRSCRDLLDRVLAHAPQDAQALGLGWTVHADIADVLLSQSDAAAALAEYRTSLALAERVAAADPTSDSAKRDVVAVGDRVADAQLALGDLAGALARYRDGVTRMEALTARDPTNWTWQAELAVGHATTAQVLEASGDDAGALAELRRALEIEQPVADRDPDNADWQYDVAHHEYRISELLQKRKDRAALTSLDAAIQRTERLLAKAPAHSRALQLRGIEYHELGAWLEDAGDWAGALDAYRKRLAVAESLSSHDPGNADLKDDLGFAHINVGNAELATGQRDEAVASYRTTLQIRTELLAAHPASEDFADNLARAHRKLGEALLAQGRRGEALAELRAGVDLLARLPPAQDRTAALASMRDELAAAQR